jgi:hypothetical protein
MVMKLPSDLLIFSSPIFTQALCSQYFTKGIEPV